MKFWPPINFALNTYIVLLAVVLSVQATLLTSLELKAEVEKTLLLEEFNDLNAWKPLEFSKISRHSQYQTIALPEGGKCLRAESNDSASAIVWGKSFLVKDYPHLSWKWKIDRVYAKGDATLKSGDDYPIRVYVLFEYEAQNAPFWKKAKYKAAKTVYGQYPPDSTLNYIWANKAPLGEILTSVYTDSAKLLVLQTGKSKAGQWVHEEVDILSDYRKAFGVEPPARATLAIMNDSDNTGEKGVSYIDQLKLSRK